MVGLALGDIGRLGARGRRAGYCAEATALFARMTTQPDATRKALIDTTIRALKSCGVWAKLDALYLLAAHDAQAARLSWVANEALSAINAPIFTADRGYKGDGASAYLSGPLTIAKQSQNSAHLSVTIQLFGGSGGVIYISNNSRFVANPLRGRINDNTYYDYSPSTTGRLCAVRTSSSDREFFRNGVSVSANSAASLAYSGTLFYLLSNAGASPCLDRVSSCSMGAPLSAVEVSEFDAALSNYFTSIGA